jgi:hypothetical protein
MWLSSLSEFEVRQLTDIRMEVEQIVLSKGEIDFIWKSAGGHPHLTQQTINILLDDRKAERTITHEALSLQLLQKYDHDFSKWWNIDGSNPNGFSVTERDVYRELVFRKEGTFETLSKSSELPPLRVLDSLQVLAGTGVIRRLDDEAYVIGSDLFEKWVTQHP